MNSLDLTSVPRGLYGICDDSVRPELPLEEKARRMLDGGTRILQLRMKSTPVRRALEAAKAIAAACREGGAVCLVNDRVDLAWLAGAHGVHLGDQDLPVREARRLLGPQAIVGATVRTAEAAQVAAANGASYVGVGPVFSTSTKVVNARVLGLDGLTAVVKGSPLPVVAIAGIGLANIAEVAATGAHGAAVISDLLLAEDLAERARALQAAFVRVARTA